ncbi:hypothetical protein JJD41_21615 [Oxynema sp. CENA135]|uniref:hypothetical protein n=1 Tax=Oxynema sp. CENA135 TaxID=984206 RepID=UPI00190B4A7B|nr:hypothetical protein [Oxynema sp. CENA135]MBK4732441.1 hypothetical protein [Oxynema sp. CENA135]
MKQRPASILQCFRVMNQNDTATQHISKKKLIESPKNRSKPSMIASSDKLFISPKEYLESDRVPSSMSNEMVRDADISRT